MTKKATKAPTKKASKAPTKGRAFALDPVAAMQGSEVRATEEPPIDEKPVMIAARVHPKLQYGLRLLSRVQGGTIAEALEWAINLAMRSTRIGSGMSEERLYTIVDRVWKAPTEPRRIYVLDCDAPELLDFDGRSAWNLVMRCDDLWEEKFFSIGGHPDEEIIVNEVSRSEPYDHSTRKPRFDLIEEHWPKISETGIALTRAGEIMNRYQLKQILDGSVLRIAGLTG